jgi:hypothetical protein
MHYKNIRNMYVRVNIASLHLSSTKEEKEDEKNKRNTNIRTHIVLFQYS